MPAFTEKDSLQIVYFWWVGYRSLLYNKDVWTSINATFFHMTLFILAWNSTAE